MRASLMVFVLGAALECAAGCATGAQIAGTESSGGVTSAAGGAGGAATTNVGGSAGGNGGSAGNGSGAGESGGSAGAGQSGGSGGTGSGGAGGGTGALGGAGGGAQGGGGTGAETGSGGAGGVPEPKCGDGVINGDEACEGANLEGKTCESLGFLAGELSCTRHCELDDTQCHKCGNGAIDPALGEDCDFDANGNPLVLSTCAGIGFGGSSANPKCDPTCHYDTTPCLCGNGMIDGAEECDGASFGGETCATMGFTGGMLSCNAACQIGTAGCTKCGNSAVEPGETCDDGNVMSGDGCSASCQTEVLSCDPDGIYAIVMGGPIAYSCCSGLVSVNVSSLILTADGATILSSPSNPAPMAGSATTCPSGSFGNSASIPGGCTETYSVSGSFTGPNTWSGLYTISFTGQDCSCFGGLFGTPCIGQVYPITAMR